jgi:hypothetical protein
MTTGFADTVLEEEEGRLALRDGGGALLVELRGEDIQRAAHAGFIDRRNLHASLYEYARMLREAGPPVTGAPAPRRAASLRVVRPRP